MNIVWGFLMCCSRPFGFLGFFFQVIEGYYNKVNDPVSKGGTFFAVCRGKVRLCPLNHGKSKYLNSTTKVVSSLFFECCHQV